MWYVPPNLHKDCFQTGALDNIDNDPKSTTGKWAFHGTAISVTSHVTSENQGERGEITLIDQSEHRAKVDTLPDEYAIVPPAALQNKSSCVPLVIGEYHTADHVGETYTHTLDEEKQWLNSVVQIHADGQLRNGQSISWSAYNAEKQNDILVLLK